MAITGNLGPSSRVTALGDLHEVVALRYCLHDRLPKSNYTKSLDIGRINQGHDAIRKKLSNKEIIIGVP